MPEMNTGRAEVNGVGLHYKSAGGGRLVLFLRDPKAERVLSENGFARLLKMRFRGGAPDETVRKTYLDAWSQPGALSGSLNYYRSSPLYPPSPEDQGAAKLNLGAKDFIVRVPDAAHWVMEEKPDLVNAEIRRFITTKERR